MEHLRSLAAPFVAELAREIVASGARVVGCTSVFQQHTASLALLRKVKELKPDVVTMLGGANCEGPMGLATRRNFPWVDYVVSGEADELIVPLVKEGRAEHGVLDGSPHAVAPRATVRALDALPIPSFADYFQGLEACGLGIEPGLPIETARGCWWGAKHHCTFCGLNGSGMGFRAKSPERALAEFAELRERHGVSNFLIVDNILAMDYFKTVVPALRGQGYRLFVETKANLKKAQLEDLHAAGVSWLLPGLESLQDDVLQLMDKGTTGLTNLQTLKWARELGMHVSWSLLCQFPGESDEWYAEMAEFLPWLQHLQPPGAVIPVGYHRFSPYFERASEYGVRHRPCPAYAAVYPLPAEELAELAYFYEDAPGSVRTGAEGPGLAAVRARVLEWAVSWRRPLPTVLSMAARGEDLEILDTRSVAPCRKHVLSGLERAVYLACDSAQTAASLRPRFGEVEGVLRELEGKRILLRHGQRYLALATAGSLPALPDAATFPGGSLVSVGGP
jgi:magnesium-protoporphyrin IX monomethyl ester (oxidative) cyclase